MPIFSNDSIITIDLDGTLIHGDMLHECIMLFIKQNPIKNIFILLFWLPLGKAKFKSRLASSVKVEPRLLPYRLDLLEFLKSVKNETPSVKLVLATASNMKLAKLVAGELKIFDDVVASDESINLKGKQKAEILNQKYGKFNYVYAGNSKSDLEIWKCAKSAIVVGNKLSRQIPASIKVDKVFLDHSSVLALLKAMRPKQWVKNLLIFLPLLMAHKLTNIESWTSALLAFASFSLVAVGRISNFNGMA